jgi:hypothetical protein
MLLDGQLRLLELTERNSKWWQFWRQTHKKALEPIGREDAPSDWTAALGQEMQILSTPYSMFVTRVLPFMVVAGVCGWVYWPKRHEGAESLAIALIVFVIANLLMYRELRKGPWRKADVVEDRGDRLLITRWKTAVEVPLSQVEEIMRVQSLGSMEVIIILKTPCAFGPEIAFYPPHKRKVPGIERALDGLSRRVSSQ